ncbi:RNA polymerase sigma factor [Novosphingobium sp.]|uniref:RNA polymerase sigma factor n=1 Tax=Novosphingobium sp. TaxID=1874826 RepID=UPI0027363A75|nr:RNA polymerase sigma factor [Novosphingobium sp.]MDP3908235.1 RNA polymerase sigma factor [Novosphingobium sp.]
MTLLSLDFSEHTAWSDSPADEFFENATTPDLVANQERKACKATETNYDDILKSVLPHVPDLRRYFKWRLPVDDVDDAIQDVLLRILRRSDLTALDRPKCYLFQAAQAALIDRHRRQNTRKALLHCELMDEMHPVDELHPLHILIARDEFRAVEDVLSKLPARTREIIISVRLEGVSLKDLARKYAISTSAIEKHVTKAIKALDRSKSGSNFIFSGEAN